MRLSSCIEFELMCISILLLRFISAHFCLNSSYISRQRLKFYELISSTRAFVYFWNKNKRNLRWIILAFSMRNLSWLYAVCALYILQFFWIVTAASSGPRGPLNIRDGILMILLTSSLFAMQS